MFALTLVVQGLILAFLILNIRVFGQALQMIDCIHDMVHDIEESSEAVEQAFLQELTKVQEEQEKVKQNMEDWTWLKTQEDLESKWLAGKITVVGIPSLSLRLGKERGNEDGRGQDGIKSPRKSRVAQK